MPARSRHTDLALFRRLARQAKPYWPHILGYLLIGLLASPLGLLTPLPLKIAVDSVLGSQPPPAFLARFIPGAWLQDRIAILWLAIALVIVVAVLDRLQTIASAVLAAYVGEGMLREFRSVLFRHAQRLSIAYHDVRGTADTLYRIQSDAASIQYIFIDGLVPFVTAVLTFSIMVSVTFRMDWQLGLVALTICPILYLLSKTYRPRLRSGSREAKKIESSAQEVMQEALSALRVVKAFGTEDQERNRYLARSMGVVRARVQLAWLEGRYDLLVGLTTALGTSVVLWIGVRHVQTAKLTLGDLLLLMSYLAQLYSPLKTIGRKAASLQGHLAGAERAFSVLDRTPDVGERPDARPLVRAPGAVCFCNVSMAYAEGHPVLEEISFELPPGSRVGIVGRTGAGKTTLLHLLLRFFDPTSGQVLLDGVDVRDYRLADLRNQFAIVLQEPVLFSATIAENISYARPDASMCEIVKAAKAADADDFIASLPYGYQTKVGERGMRLSGGERQRISLARAFLKDAPILLLDEPTSSVDIKTEVTIMEAILRLMQGRTAFIIAHRLSTLEHCNVKLALENGRATLVNYGFPPLAAEAGAAPIPMGRQ
jgi:ATP-binding cassette, subfamily B, bacterial